MYDLRKYFTIHFIACPIRSQKQEKGEERKGKINIECSQELLSLFFFREPKSISEYSLHMGKCFYRCSFFFFPCIFRARHFLTIAESRLIIRAIIFPLCALFCEGAVPRGERNNSGTVMALGSYLSLYVRVSLSVGVCL